MRNSNRSTVTLDINSPVVIGFAALSLVLLLLAYPFPGLRTFMSVRYISWLSPKMYLSFFTHPLMHADFAHFINNFLLIFALGPTVEERYGSGRLLIMMALCALVTGIFTALFYRHVIMCGASGILFMLIVLASYVNIRAGKIPVTAIAVLVLFLGKEIAEGLFRHDNIAHWAHVVGGGCGAVFGFFFAGKKLR
jgi:membrane associated rhomboid family serine protease